MIFLGIMGNLPSTRYFFWCQQKLAHNGDLKLVCKKVYSFVVKMKGQSTIYCFWFSCNINLKLGQIFTKNADSKKSADFTKTELHSRTTSMPKFRSI